MGWSLGLVNGRDVGYGVPAYCDHPGCKKEINRGISYLCGGIHSDHGCGLFFCEEHRYYHTFRDGEVHNVCKRCHTYKSPFPMKKDHPEWIEWKLKDKSWKEWRKNHPKEVEKMKNI